MHRFSLWPQPITVWFDLNPLLPSILTSFFSIPSSKNYPSLLLFSICPWPIISDQKLLLWLFCKDLVKFFRCFQNTCLEQRLEKPENMMQHKSTTGGSSRIFEGYSFSFLESNVLYWMETRLWSHFLIWISKPVEPTLGNLLCHLAWLLSFTLRKTFVSLENEIKFGELLHQLV